MPLVHPSADKSVIQQIRSAVPNKAMFLPTADLDAAIRASREKVLAVVGHIEGNDFVVLAADGSETSRHSISRLERVARESNTVLLSLGCGAGQLPGTSGPRSSIHTEDLGTQLRLAFSTSNFAEMIAALETRKVPIVLDLATSKAAEQAIRARRMRRVKGITAGTIALTTEVGIVGTITHFRVGRMDED